MGYTVDQLQRQLDPQTLVHQVFNSFRGNAGDVTHKAFGVIKKNPIPAAIIGVGVVLMIIEMKRRSKNTSTAGRRRRRRHPLSERSPIQSSRRSMRDVPAEVSYTELRAESYGRVSPGALRESGCGCGESDFESVSYRQERSRQRGIGRKIKSKGRQLRSQAMHRMQDMRGYVGEHLHQGTARAKDWFGQAIDEYPLAVGAAFFTLGLIGGFAIPASPPENRYLGKARDRLFNQAQEYGSELIDKGQKAAERVVQSVKESVGSESEGERASSRPS